MTKSDYKLIAKTLRAHFAARMKYMNSYEIISEERTAQEIFLALGLAFEQDSARKDQDSMQDEIRKSFDLTQFLKECLV